MTFTLITQIDNIEIFRDIVLALAAVFAERAYRRRKRGK